MVRFSSFFDISNNVVKTDFFSVMFGNFRDHSDTNHLNPEDSNGILSKVRHLSGCSTTSNDELPVSAASIEADRNKNQR